MLLFITGGVGFALSVLAILLIVQFHKKDKKKMVPLIMYGIGFLLFMGSGFLHWRGVELNLPKLPGKEPVEDVQPADGGADADAADAPAADE